MYCSACGNQLAPGNSFCNRCGMGLKERSESKNAPIAAFLTAITLLGVIGMGIMLGGALTLTNEAHLKEELVGFFMFFTFVIVLASEVLLVRQLSRFTSSATKMDELQAPPVPTVEFRTPPPRSLAEPLPSVTENTTRTLEFINREQSR
jgi:hypothetical protein